MIYYIILYYTTLLYSIVIQSMFKGVHVRRRLLLEKGSLKLELLPLAQSSPRLGTLFNARSSTLLSRDRSRENRMTLETRSTLHPGIL